MNRSLEISDDEIKYFSKRLLNVKRSCSVNSIKNKTINQDLFEVLELLPHHFIDLLFIDPPYNINKSFRSSKFKSTTISDYSKWIEKFLEKLTGSLKKTASIYFCGDWKSSTSIHSVLSKFFIVRNRITWERDKGRGSKKNWKNNSEDIWFCTVSEKFTFNSDSVKLKRKVLAPYRNSDGVPKDWKDSEKGSFRLTFPSNIWIDISVPFWSMPENTEHPTQKPEKLLAKIILASSNPGDLVFDPFLGSGTTSVVAKKLNRHYVGVELDNKYACLAEKRIEMAKKNKSIQGYTNGIFWERNTLKFR
ncbi:DNA-methyltransferase [Bacteroidota bacterium]